jgi:hypothetical protein
LANQKASDAAEKAKMEADCRRIDEMARLEAEREKKEKAEALRVMKEEEENIKAAERELARKRKALHDAQKAAAPPVNIAVDEDDEDEDDDDAASVSTVGEPVSNL